MYSLRNRPEKLAKGSLFYLFLKLVQIIFLFTDNVRILYIYGPSHDEITTLDLTWIIPHLCRPLVSPYTIYGPSNGGITTLDLTWIIPHLYGPLSIPYTIYGPSNGGITTLDFTWISPISIDHWLILVLEIVLYMAHLMMDSNQMLHCNICTHLYSDKREELFLNNWSQYTLISSLGISKPCCLFNICENVCLFP